ncbi:MAG: type II secretion system protein N, partial [Gammaproteobacteria bacterium]|nr:type II secretion system protein N [Gammaproteobacteria bacterium]
MKRRYYILTAIISYLFFTLASMPAATAFSLLKNNIKLPFTLQGIDGSIWNGSAQRLSIPSAPQIENLNWQLNPFSLLIARVNADVEADIYRNKLTGNITVSSNGDISASNIHTNLTGETVQKLIDLPLGEIDGDFEININSFELSNNTPVVNGIINWNKAKFTLADSVNLGNVEL